MDVPGPACAYFFFFAAFFFVDFFFAPFFLAAIPNHLPVTQLVRWSPQTSAGTVPWAVMRDGPGQPLAKLMGASPASSQRGSSKRATMCDVARVYDPSA